MAKDIKQCNLAVAADSYNPEGGTCPLCWEWHDARTICRSVAGVLASRVRPEEQARATFETWLIWHFERAGLVCRRSMEHRGKAIDWQRELLEACWTDSEGEAQVALVFGVSLIGGSQWSQTPPTAAEVHNSSGIAVCRDEDGELTTNTAQLFEIQHGGVREAALRCFRRLILANWSTGFTYAPKGLHRDQEVMRRFADAGGEDLRWLVEKAEGELDA